MQSIVFFTTQTSATASIWRILNAINQNKLYSNNFIGDNLALGASLDNIKNIIIPPNDNLVFLNNPATFNRSISHEMYKWIINFRDPRDRLCNSYHWFFNHPVYIGESAEEIATRAQQLEKQGIDSWVLEKANPKYFENTIWALENIDPSCIQVLTYARLCLDFDSFIERCHIALSANSNDSDRAAIELERVDNLNKNPKWIGQTWKGSDISPGRYEYELKSETVQTLSNIFKNTLNAFAKYDPDYANQYLANT
jgi:hypothetical protein